ncbi:MAG: AAA family ATPase [Desulfitobacteriaceae bacterium]|nr:AAA family ATPase [Desulfitobacteriaceae bacterium]MDI6913184.1 AAA family ATPase [Desulfitobacteriaceae bacterium]
MPIRVTFPGHQAPPIVNSPQPLEPAQPPQVLENGQSWRKGSTNSKQANAQTEKERIHEILAELDALIGLNSVKQLIRELQAFVEIQKRRTREKLVAESLVLHMIFRGNPGTGKTTVARIVGRLFKEMGVLQKGHIIECERADLVGEYIGHTAQKTREQVKKALGGVLFVDEAYSLARGGEKDFGKEAIDALVKSMEDNKESMILILAGYRQEMEWFLQTNPGLRSRFPIHIDFPDYSLEELSAIGQSMFRQRQYELTPEAYEALRRILLGLVHTHPYAGNARLIRNLVERTIRKQAVRLFQRPNSTRDELIQILPADFDWEEPE